MQEALPCVGALLQDIDGPAQLKALSLSELQTLASEIRGALVATVPCVGGHFASNLGNVELSIALLYVFESPTDAIVWDVSHGCYPYKLLTGRWKSGTFGAFTMGTEHGLFCIGCCWLLMALLFVGGIMNLIWVAAIATFVLMEKVALKGEVVGRAGGVLLIAFAGYVAFHS